MCYVLDRGSGEKLSQRVNDAVNLLTDYNSRLSVEVESRKKVTTMLRDFLQVQRELLAQAEQNLEVCIAYVFAATDSCSNV